MRRDEGSTQSLQGKRWGSVLVLGEGVQGGKARIEGSFWVEACGGESQESVL